MIGDERDMEVKMSREARVQAVVFKRLCSSMN
jgi:hypothetical protein